MCIRDRYALPFTVTLQADGLDVLPTTGDVSLLNGLLTNLVSNTLAADRAAHIMLLCTPGRLCYRDNGPGLPPDAAALLPQQPAARQERFGTKFNTAVNGFYKSLDDTFKSFTLTAENGLDQIRAQSIGGSTAKGE